MRRQSARFKSEEPKPAEDAVESTGLVSGPNCDDQMQDDVSTSICLSAEEDDKASGNRRFVGTFLAAQCVFLTFIFSIKFSFL